MTATAEGAFRIIDQASGTIKKIRSGAETMDKAVKGAGKALDDLDSPKVRSSLDAAKRGVEKMTRSSEDMGRTVERNSRKAGDAFEKMAAKGTASVEELTFALKRFEHERATATMDIDITRAEAKIRVIKHELRTVSTAEARKELNGLGLVADSVAAKMGGGGGLGGGGGGGPGGVAGGLSGALGGVGGSAALMGGAILLALPAVEALGGAVSALAGSAAMAAGGAGAIGVGSMGAMVVGIGALVAVAKPALTVLKNLKKEQDAYNKAVQQYGSQSSQAAKAQRLLTQAQRKNPGAADVLTNVQVLQSRWTKGTRPGQADFFGILNDGLRTASSLLPTFERIANNAMGSARRGVDNILAPFRTGEWRGIFRTLGDTFDKLVSGPVSRGIANMGLFFGRVAQAASPVVVRVFDALERWTAGLSRGVSDRARTEQTIERLVGHLRDWVHMGGAAVKLMAAFFGAGAAQGQSVVESITTQLDKWTQWLHEHPGEVQQFFSRTIHSAGELVSALGQIGKALGEISDTLLPLLDGISSLVSGSGSTGMLGPLTMAGGAAFLMRKKLFGSAEKAAVKTVASGVTGSAEATAAEAVAAGGAASAAGRVGLMTRAAVPMALVGSLAGSYVGNRVGGRAGGAISGVAQGAALGAMAGSVIPGIGTLAGAGIGAVGGGIIGLVSSGPHADPTASGIDRAARWLGRGRATGDLRGQVGHLQRLLGAQQPYTTMGGPHGVYRVPVASPMLKGDARKNVQAQLDALKPVLKTQVKVEDSNRAYKALDKMHGAFDVYQTGNAAQRAKGRSTLIDDYMRSFRSAGPDGKRILSQGVAQWIGELQKGDRSSRRLARGMSDALKQSFTDIGQHIRLVDGQIYTGTRAEWQGIATNLQDPVEQAQESVTKGFTEIQKQAVASLRTMGYNPDQARSIVSGIEGGSRAASLDAAQGPSGSGLRPSTNAKRVAAAHGDGTGDYLRRAGSQSPGSGLMGASAALAPFDRRAHQYGLHVTSGLRPGAITASGNVSLHASGHAIDESGSPAGMLAFAKDMVHSYGSQLAELIHTPLGFGIKNGRRVPLSFWGSAINQEHYNHVHVGFTGQAARGGGGPGGIDGGASGAQQLRLRRLLAGGRGVPGALAQGALDVYASGLQSRINRRLGATGGGGGGLSSAGGQYSKGALARLWTRAGGPPGVAGLMAAIALAESGGNPRAHNPSGASGLWQILGVPFRGNVWNPLTNARMAVAKYKTQGLGAWEAYTNGMYRRFAGDGTGHVRMKAPTFGGGPVLRAQPTGIRPASTASVSVSGGDRSIHLSVHVAKVENHREGDVAEMIKKELTKVAADLARSGEDDELGDD